MSHGFRTVGLVCLTVVLVAAAPQGASAAETADLTFVAAPCRDAYLEIAGVWGLEIPAPSGLPGRFSLTVSGKNHKDTEDVTLEYRFDWSRRHESGDSKLTERFQSSRQTVRLSQGEALVMPLQIESPERALVLTIGPKIIRPMEFDPEDVEPLMVGTESQLSCPDPSPLEEALRGSEVMRDPVPIIRQNEPPRGVIPGSGGVAPMGWYDGRPARVTPVSPVEAGSVEDPEDESGGSEAPPPN